MQLLLDQIYTIKITNGDELVTKITAEHVDSYTAQRPLTVVPGREGIQLIFSLFTANPDKTVTINKSAVALLAISRDEVQDSYTEATTGIKPVRNNKILLS